mmetsp:Transcript_14860/g.19489  ORF Transcript_14860/g.19489 Transcript_14860/m.19489 type:complete len:355 (+) Transcript_14860:186-1250(+)
MFRNQSVIRLSRQRLCARFYGKYMRACEIKSQGGDSNSLRITEVQVPQPSEGEILVKNEAAGLNFIDCYHRSGLYPRETPFILGVEGAGTVVAAGPNVDLDSFSPNNPSLKGNIVGARVGYYGTDTYSEYTVVPLEQSFPLPEDIGWNDAVSVVTQGLTAHYLVRSTYKLDDHDWCLIHACAGGTGQLMVQMAKILGANVIGSCSPSKADVALSLGLDYCIDYSDIEAKVKEITKGRGVDVVYDGVGATTWEASLNSLRPRGMAVFFGNASGPVPSIDPLILNSKGSLFMTRPKLYDYLQNRQELLWRVNEVFDWMRAGKLKVAVDREFNLEDVNLAHEYIESGNTRGKVIIKI